MKKLNFGCGKVIKEGWDNVDVLPDAPIRFNFNKFPYPLKKNFYDYVLVRQVLEFCLEPEQVLNELHKACKNKAIIEIYTPHYQNIGSYNDMGYHHHFSEQTFKIFIKCTYRDNKKFRLVSQELIPSKVGKFIPRTIREKLSYFIGGLLMTIHVKLEVIK